MLVTWLLSVSVVVDQPEQYSLDVGKAATGRFGCTLEAVVHTCEELVGPFDCRTPHVPVHSSVVCDHIRHRSTDFDDTMDPLIGFHLLSKQRNAVVCRDGCIKCIDAIPRLSSCMCWLASKLSVAIGRCKLVVCPSCNAAFHDRY